MCVYFERVLGDGNSNVSATCPPWHCCNHDKGVMPAALKKGLSVQHYKDWIKSLKRWVAEHRGDDVADDTTCLQCLFPLQICDHYGAQAMEDFNCELEFGVLPACFFMAYTDRTHLEKLLKLVDPRATITNTGKFGEWLVKSHTRQFGVYLMGGFEVFIYLCQRLGFQSRALAEI